VSGIGTVIVPSEVRRGMTMDTADFASGDDTRPTIDVERRHKYARPQAPGDLSGVRRLEEQTNHLPEVRGGLFDRLPLTGKVELAAERDAGVVLSFENGRKGALGHRGTRLVGYYLLSAV
jgi:hypothetical protein